MLQVFKTFPSGPIEPLLTPWRQQVEVFVFLRKMTSLLYHSLQKTAKFEILWLSIHMDGKVLWLCVVYFPADVTWERFDAAQCTFNYEVSWKP